MGRRGLGLLVLAALLPACSRGPDGPLFDNGWVLSDVIQQGQPVEVPSPSSNRWRFLGSGGCEDGSPDCPDGPKLRGTDLCNSFMRSVNVDGDTVVWGTYWASTAAACGPVGGGDPVEEFFRQPSFRFVVEGDEMRATSEDGSIELVFTAGA